MLTVDEIEARILGELEEAGCDATWIVANTILRPKRSSAHLENFRSALKNCIKNGMVRMLFRLELGEPLEPLSTEDSLQIAESIGDYIEFGANGPYWAAKNGREEAQIILTDKGQMRAREILDERGYDWYFPERRDRLPRKD